MWAGWTIQAGGRKVVLSTGIARWPCSDRHGIFSNRIRKVSRAAAVTSPSASFVGIIIIIITIITIITWKVSRV